MTKKKEIYFDIFDIFKILISNKKKLLLFSVSYFFIFLLAPSLISINKDIKIEVTINFEENINLPSRSKYFSNFLMIDRNYIVTSKLFEHFNNNYTSIFLTKFVYNNETLKIQNKSFYTDENTKKFFKNSLVKHVSDKRAVLVIESDSKHLNLIDRNFIDAALYNMNLRMKEITLRTLLRINTEILNLAKSVKNMNNQIFKNKILFKKELMSIYNHNNSIINGFSKAKVDDIFYLDSYKVIDEKKINFRYYALIFLVYIFILIFSSTLYYGHYLKKINN